MAGQHLQKITGDRTRATLLLVILSLLEVAPALAQQDRCYPGLDCPSDRPSAAPPANPPPQQYPQQYTPPPPPQYPPPNWPNYRQMAPTYSAISRCSITGAIGVARGMPTAELALLQAAKDCASKGGVPECCLSGAILVP